MKSPRGTTAACCSLAMISRRRMWKASYSNLPNLFRGDSMRLVGAFEAKNKLSQLLDLVEQGEEITIPRHGREVARLVSARPAHSRDAARAAVRRMRERA